MKAGELGAILLCGGQSRRMGRDKGSLAFGPETLLARVLRQLHEATPHIVLAAGPSQPVPAGIRVSRDTTAAAGPLPALLDALNLLDTEYVFVVACDTPLLQAPMITLLLDLCRGWDGAVPVVRGRRVATCAVYRTGALRDARAGFGDPRHKSLLAFLETLLIREVPEEVLREADPNLLSFTPCNTPEEYRRALALAGG